MNIYPASKACHDEKMGQVDPCLGPITAYLHRTRAGSSSRIDLGRMSWKRGLEHVVRVRVMLCFGRLS